MECEAPSIPLPSPTPTPGRPPTTSRSSGLRRAPVPVQGENLPAFRKPRGTAASQPRSDGKGDLGLTRQPPFPTPRGHPSPSACPPARPTSPQGCLHPSSYLSTPPRLPPPPRSGSGRPWRGQPGWGAAAPLPQGPQLLGTAWREPSAQLEASAAPPAPRQPRSESEARGGRDVTATSRCGEPRGAARNGARSGAAGVAGR